MSNIKIYHNPRCSKSRKTLEIIQQHGFSPEIVEYLKTPPSPSELELVLQYLAISPRDLMRKGEADYKENNMSNTALTDSQLIELMHQFPKVIERPIVIKQNKAIIGRPPESVLTLL